MRVGAQYNKENIDAYRKHMRGDVSIMHYYQPMNP